MSPARPTRWRDEALQQLIRRARAGESWAAIGVDFYRGNPRAGKSASNAFGLYASAEDKAERRRALAQVNRNRPRRYAKRGMPGGQARLEPSLRREKEDIFSGMGSCFA